MMFSDLYLTISNESKGYYREKGSKFHGFAVPASTEAEVKEFIKSFKKQYFDATHHCFAYVLGFDQSATRMNDDGEPSGTAGRPIMGQIQSFGLTNVLVLVIRYYGGVKLGVPGLIHAYKTAANDALSHAKIVEKRVLEIYEILFPYEGMNEIMHMIKETGAEVLSNQSDLICKLEIAIQRSKSAQFSEQMKKKQNTTMKYLKSV